MSYTHNLCPRSSGSLGQGIKPAWSEELQPLLAFFPLEKRVSLDLLPICSALLLCVLFFCCSSVAARGLRSLKLLRRPRSSFFSREGHSVKGGGRSCAEPGFFHLCHPNLSIPRNPELCLSIAQQLGADLGYLCRAFGSRDGITKYSGLEGTSGDLPGQVTQESLQEGSERLWRGRLLGTRV